MTLRTFDIKYKDVYTSAIDFKTQITEMQLGQEQRYPVWTYPKRTFTLTFEKDKVGREELEEFYIDVITNYNGQFTFIWDTAKGGNGLSYTCWIESDSFEMTMQDYGFCENAKLEIMCIDRNAVVPPDSFNFYHKAEANYSITMDRIRDSIVTASYKLRNLWQAPRRSWTLTFEKTPEVRKQLEAWFIAKRGKFRYFEWTWETERGGNGNTYNVRFDDDSLSMDIQDYGFAEFQIKLKEVFPNPNPIEEYDKDELIPRKLLNIDVEGGGVHILDNETLDLLQYDNINYIGAPLEHGEIIKDDNSSVSKLDITVSNVGQGISGIISNRGDKITNAPATLTMVLLNVTTNNIISDTETIIWAGKCNNLKIDNEKATIDIETPLGGFEVTCPVMRYRVGCQVRRFKDCRCGYTGTETACDRTFARCKELGNESNFRGFPSVPIETVIKAAG